MPTPLISGKIAAVRRKSAVVSVLLGAAIIALIAAGVLAASMLLDWLVELPWAVRLAVLVLLAGTAAYIAFRKMLLPVIAGPDDEDVALMVERAEPFFQSRLIASVQLARPGAIQAGASPQLVAAMIAQTEEMSRPVEFTRVVPTDSLIIRAAGAIAAVLAFAAGVGFAGETGAALLQRAMLVDVQVPRKTKVDLVDEAELIVPMGESALLRARIGGIVRPDEGTLKITYASGKTQTLPVVKSAPDPAAASQPSDAAPELRITLENVQESFEYRFYAGDGKSKSAKVRVESRPAPTQIELRQIWPAYTGLPPQIRQAGDLTLLAGSRLEAVVTANKPLRAAGNELRLTGTGRVFTLDLDPANPRRAVVRDRAVPIAAGTTGLTVQLVDTFGLSSKDAAVYRVDVVADKKPTLRILRPTLREELATPTARIEIEFDAADDFGIAQVVLHYSVTARILTREGNAVDPAAVKPGPEKTAVVWAAAKAAPAQRNVRGVYTLDLATLGLTEGAVVTWRLEAVDNNNETGPGVTSSERYQSTVVSAAAKRQELMDRLNEKLVGGIGEVERGSSELRDNLGNLVEGKPATKPATQPSSP